MKKPLVWLAAMFCAGIAASNLLRIKLSWLYPAGAICLFLVFKSSGRKIYGTVYLAALAFLVGMIWLANYQVLPGCHIQRFRYDSRELYALRGWVNSEPEYKDNNTSFLFQSEEIAAKNWKRACCGQILVIVRGELKAGYGQELTLEAGLRRAIGEYLLRQGISLIARVKTPDFVALTGKDKGWAIKRAILKLKSRIESKLENNLTPVCAGVVEAMVLGEDRNVPPKIYKDMIRSGTVHILVVSGSNVGVVGFIAVILLKVMRVKRRLRFFFCVAFLLGYCILTGASNPVVRATIMAVVFLFAYLVKREPDIYNSCASAALAILAINPAQFFNIGFQLSFASVWAIAFFYPRLKKLFHLDKVRSWFLRLPAEGFLVSLSAWLGTAALIAAYFRMVSPVTVLANLLIVPLASLITLIGFSLLVLQSLSPYLSLSFASGSEFLVSLLLLVNNVLLRLPGAYFYF
jgi:competence protein ComEC